MKLLRYGPVGQEKPGLLDAEGTLRDRRVLGLLGLDHIVVQGDIEAVALTRQFGDQQAVEGVLGERAVDRRRGCGGRFGTSERKLNWLAPS